MPDFTAIDPDVLDEQAAYGPEPARTVAESVDERAERLAAAFEHGATLKLDAPPIEGATGDTVGDDGEPVKRRRRGRQPGTSPRRTVAGAQIGTLFVAGATILIGFTIGEWAAPTGPEADAMAVPLGNILARRIDLAAKLGRDTDDVVTLAIAVMAWMARVGPIAAGRAREAYAERNARRDAARVDRPPEPVRSTNRGGTGGMADGRDDGPHSPLGATHRPVDAIASLAERQLGYLDANLDRSS